jgi:menaquinone-dependent protoporphyrinogen oxidase
MAGSRPEDPEMTRVLIAYGSRHGATRGIAERVGSVLRREGIDVIVEAAERVRIIEDVDGFVVGSGVYMGSWLKEPLAFLEQEQALLSTRPTWLFSSGPLKGSTKNEVEKDPLESALGPSEGPGSGGRRRIAELAAAIGVRDHRVFYGAFDPTDPPKAMSERFVRMMPGSKGILPPGDYRDWDDVESWAREIAAAVKPAAIVSVT